MKWALTYTFNYDKNEAQFFESFDEEILEELVDNVTSEDSNCMETFIPGFHD